MLIIAEYSLKGLWKHNSYKLGRETKCFKMDQFSNIFPFNFDALLKTEIYIYTESNTFAIHWHDQEVVLLIDKKDKFVIILRPTCLLLFTIRCRHFFGSHSCHCSLLNEHCFTIDSTCYWICNDKICYRWKHLEK